MEKTGEIINTMISQLSSLLRYIASGFIALIALFILYPRAIFKISHFPIPAIYLFTLLAVLIGILIYALHLNILKHIVIKFIIFPILSCKCPIFREYMDKWKKNNIASEEIDFARWLRRGTIDNISPRNSEKEEIIAVQQELNKWADLMNFLYCSSYSIFIVLLLVPITTDHCNMKAWYIFLGASLVSWAIAVCSDYRITCREVKIINKYQSEISLNSFPLTEDC